MYSVLMLHKGEWHPVEETTMPERAHAALAWFRASYKGYTFRLVNFRGEVIG